MHIAFLIIASWQRPLSGEPREMEMMQEIEENVVFVPRLIPEITKVNASVRWMLLKG